MAKAKLSEQEWETFLGLADRLGVNLRTLLTEDGRFHDLEAAGHALGRAVAQATTERLAFAGAIPIFTAISGKRDSPLGRKGQALFHAEE